MPVVFKIQKIPAEHLHARWGLQFVFFTAVLFACFGALFFCAVVGFDAFAVLGDVSAVSVVVHKYQFEQL